MRPFSNIADRCAWWMSKRELQRYMWPTNPAKIVRATDLYQGHGKYRHINALHDPTETVRLASLVQRLRPRRIMEIGTCWGGTLFVWCRSNPHAELIISMDLPGGEFGGGYGPEREKLYRAFAEDRPQLQLELLRVDSHAHSSYERVEGLLCGHQLDFLFIDGDHTYEGVRRDFEMYSPLVRVGGLVALHDINTKAPDHKVRDFWADIRGQYDSEEIIARPELGVYGIGLIHMAHAAAARSGGSTCESHGSLHS
jgi:cephalosporin hydroxylase